MTDDHDHFMELALVESRKAGAEGNAPVGSIIVRNGEVIGVGRNRVNSQTDPTAHAEVDAIRDACQNIGSTDLSGALCYTAMEPCPMCCWAIEASGCSGVVMGARHGDFRGPGGDDYGAYTVEALLAMTGRSLEVVTGIKDDDCNALRREWVASKQD